MLAVSDLLEGEALAGEALTPQEGRLIKVGGYSAGAHMEGHAETPKREAAPHTGRLGAEGGGVIFGIGAER